MTHAIDTAAIVGAGAAGLAAAIRLARGGVSVDLYESKPEISALGSGITLQGNALRVFDDLGIWEEVRTAGYPFEGLTLRAPGPGAPVVADLPDVKTGGPDYPATMGMYRPDLARIMFAAAQAAGARIHSGATVTGFTADETGVDVEVDGATGGTPASRFDLLIGADGLHSAVRERLGIETRPEPNGMGIWRAFVDRPEDVVRSELYYGGPVFIAGYTPTNEDKIYVLLVEKAQDRSGLGDDEATRIMIEESQAYDGPWNHIRASLAKGDAKVNYTRFTSHIVDEPWNRGRVVIIGDAAHSCPPTIAQGAAQALEDAYVLTELLLTRDAVDRGLWDEFHARRMPRAKAVVEASRQLAQWQLDGNREADAGGLIFSVAQQMAEPA